MPYLVKIVVATCVAGYTWWAPAEYHLEVEPGSSEYEMNQIQRAIERRLPGRTFIINDVRPDYGHVSGEEVEISMEMLEAV